MPENFTSHAAALTYLASRVEGAGFEVVDDVQVARTATAASINAGQASSVYWSLAAKEETSVFTVNLRRRIRRRAGISNESAISTLVAPLLDAIEAADTNTYELTVISSEAQEEDRETQTASVQVEMIYLVEDI